VTIGGSAALIIIGAILRFAVTWTPKNVDLQVIGVILMIGGAAGLCVAIGLMLWMEFTATIILIGAAFNAECAPRSAAG